MPSLLLEGQNGDVLDLDYVQKYGRGIQVTAGVTGFGLPPIQTRWIEGAGNGATFRGRRVLPRDIDLLLTILGRDHADLQDLLNRLARLLEGKVRLRMIEDTGTEWWLDTYWVGGGDYAYGVNGFGETDADLLVTLRAGDPFWTAETKQQKVITSRGSGNPLVRVVRDIEAVPFLTNLGGLPLAPSQAAGAITLENTGDAESHPVWEIRGPGENFEAVAPNGDTFRWIGILGPEDVLTIDTSTGLVTDQNGENRYAELDEAPRLWTIPAGTNMATASLSNTSAGAWVPDGELTITNLFANPAFETVIDTIEVRKNFASDPRATKDLPVAGALGWGPRSYGAGGGAGKTTLLTNSEGWPIPVKTCIRKTWSASPSSNDGTGFDHAATPAGGMPVTPGQMYAVSSFVRHVSSSMKRFVMKVSFYDASGARIGAENTSSPVDAFSTVPVRPWWSGVAPAGAVSMWVATDVIQFGTQAVWKSGETLEGTGLMVERAPFPGEYYDGAYSPGADFVPSWTGVAHASPSVLRVSRAKRVTASQANPVVSTQWPQRIGKTLRIIPNVPGGSDSYVAIAQVGGGDLAALEVGKTYTVTATSRMAAPLTGNLSPNGSRQIVWIGTGFPAVRSVAQANEAGVAHHRLTFVVPASGGGQLRLYNGASEGNGDVWWSDVILTEGEYDGPYFDGSITDSSEGFFDWTGTPHDSTSTKRAARLAGASRIAVSWRARKWLMV